MRKPKFLYFDLGNVLVNFDIGRMCSQMADVAQIEPGRVREVVFGSGLQNKFETGQVSSQEFYDSFCQQTNTAPDFDALITAGSDMFELNVSMMPIVAHLRQTGNTLGILSNTCDSHWNHCWKRYRILNDAFSTHTLSYEVGAAKPSKDIFQAAAKLADTAPEEILFVDDLPQHIDGAKVVGFDAIQYTSTPELVDKLRSRGLELNY